MKSGYFVRSHRMPLPVQVAANNYEPMELDVEHEDNEEQPNQNVYVIDNANIDLESYAANYQGLAKISRLEFIANHCRQLRVDALTLAINYIKENTFNVQAYNRLFKRLQEAIAESNDADMPALPIMAIPTPDQAWIDTKMKQVATKLDKLDNDLKNYKSNSIKESIRRGHDDLGDHYLDCGDLQNALKCYSRSRDYCTSPKNNVNQCLNMIRISIFTQNWNNVSSYVAKAETQVQGDNSINPTISTKLHCAAGLFELTARKYKKAAKHFLNTNFEHFHQGTSNSPDKGTCWDILCPNNIAVYGSLCALATFDRSELYKSVINSSSFKLFFELDPQLRDAVCKFYDSNYASCLSILAEIKDILVLDIYLAPHIDRLYTMIRNRALIQYFSPYSSAAMFTMATAFNTNINDLEQEVMHLILEGQIQARIDSHNKILFAKDVDQRTVTFEHAIKMGKDWQTRARALILRAAVIKSGLHVKNTANTIQQMSNQMMPANSSSSLDSSNNNPQQQQPQQQQQQQEQQQQQQQLQ